MNITTEAKVVCLNDKNSRLEVTVFVDGHRCGTTVVASGRKEYIEDYFNGLITWEQLGKQILG